MLSGLLEEKRALMAEAGFRGVGLKSAYINCALLIKGAR